MMFYTTSNNISVILLRSILLVEEVGVPGENHRPDTTHWQTLSHNVVSSTPRLIVSYILTGRTHFLIRWWCLLCIRPTLEVRFYWSNCPRVDMFLPSDTFSRFRANKSLFFLLNAGWLSKKQQILNS